MLRIVTFVAVIFCQVLGQEDIRMPPSITQGPSKHHFIYRSDDSVPLDCKGKGVPTVVYEWKKNGLELNPNQPNIEKGTDGSITIRSAAASDEGFYQCFAKNQYGTALSATAHIQRALLDSASGTPSTLQKTVQEGMPFHIQADPRKSFPKPTYGWEIATDTVDKNPVPLRPSRRIQIADNGDLHFAYATADDALDGKIYKCTTYNPHLDVKAGGSYTKLTVTRNPGGLTAFAPTLGFASETQTVAVIGGSATLRCFFSGYPEPTITWSGPRNTLPIGRYALNNFNTELVINNVTATDEGDYICTASNTQGRNTHTLQIRVEEIPIFRSVKDGPYDVNVTEGESHAFSCNVNAKPEATIVWLQDGVVLDVNSPPRRFAFSNNKKTLTIREVCRNCDDRDKQTDLTVIQCNASNIHGYAFASGYLNVLSKTKVILVDSQDVRVEMYEEREVKFECSATSDPSTPPSVRWYKVENNEEQPVQDNPPTVTIKGGALTIYVNPNGTQKWTAYHGEYRCIGDNGYSKATAAVNLIVEAYVPPVAQTGGVGDWWWIFLIIALILILLILILCCCIYLQRNKGDKYDVDEKERQNGNDPEKELIAGGFQDYRRPEGQTLKGSRGSLGSSVKLNSDEEASLNEYGDDPGKFTEDGSFVGAYTGTTDRKKGRTE